MGTRLDVSVIVCHCGHAGEYSTVIIFCIWTLSTSYPFLTNAKLIILARTPILGQLLLQINRIISLIHFLSPKALSIEHSYAVTIAYCGEIIS